MRISARLGTIAVLGFALVCLACAKPKLRKIEVAEPADLRRWCHIGAEPVNRDQALCIASIAELRLNEGAYTIETGTTLEREPIWIVRETCGRANPECVEIWVRRSDAAIVNTRYLYAFDK